MNVWKQGEWGKPLYLPPNFAVNLVCSVMSDSLWHQTVAHWVLKNSHSFLVGLQNATQTLKDSLMVSCRIKHSLTTCVSNHSP